MYNKFCCSHFIQQKAIRLRYFNEWFLHKFYGNLNCNFKINGTTAITQLPYSTGNRLPSSSSVTCSSSPSPESSTNKSEIPIAQRMTKNASTLNANRVTHSKNFLDNKQKKLTIDEYTVANLKSYVIACCASNLTDHGWAVLKHYKSKGNAVEQELYYLILNGFVSELNVIKIQEVWSTIKADHIAITPQVFALILECLGRANRSPQNSQQIKLLIDEARNHSITTDEIMTVTPFVRDQREIVLEAIRRCDINYEPNYKPPMLFYTNKLVESLNKDVAAIGENPIESKTQMASNGSNEWSVNSKEIHKMMNDQLSLERKGRFAVKTIAITSPDRQEIATISKERLNNLLTDWRYQISKSLEINLNNLERSMRKHFNHITIYPYIRVLSKDRLTDFLMEEIVYLIQTLVPYSQSSMQLYAGLGKTVMKEYQVKMKLQNGLANKITDIYPKYCEAILNSKTTDNPRQIWQRLEYASLKNGPYLNADDPTWSFTLQYNVGQFLYNILFNLEIDANINENKREKRKKHLKPVFSILTKRGPNFAREEITIHSAFKTLYQSATPDTLNFDSKIIPMLCPPLPWTNTRNGCYLLRTTDLIRPRHAGHEMIDVEKFIETVPTSNIYSTLDGLNQLGRVAWKINERILDIIIDVFNSGGNEKLSISPRFKPINSNGISIEPTDIDKNNKNRKSEKFREMKRMERHQDEMYENWCFNLYQLSMANYFRGRPFWMPQGMDFRGRVYPIPRHLNHIGADLIRCLFLFHEARPLGNDGLDWLKLNCINLSGLKNKYSVSERLQFADEIMNEIIDSADNPLTGRMWWADSDKPWQTLACCMEVTNAIRCPDPATYMCHLPIHQDGSCNGLQHYAALGRSETEAISVNLVNSVTPQDIYTDVAHAVEQIRQNDAANGVAIAEILKGFVTRKLIKKTVMTAVYGITQYGAQLYFERDLKDMKAFPQEHIGSAATYLTTATFASLQPMSTSAKAIQNWLIECAHQISDVRMRNVEWITPLGLPVQQPYVGDGNLRKSMSSIGPISMDTFKPDVEKHKIAFPPNFVHSLDATHLMMTALHCGRAGITFASIHDCFWTHAATVAEMNRICREQFVLLHSEPILADLSRFFIEKFEFRTEDLTGDISDERKIALNKILAAHPKQGKFKLESVLDSVFFFS